MTYCSRYQRKEKKNENVVKLGENIPLKKQAAAKVNLF